MNANRGRSGSAAAHPALRSYAQRNGIEEASFREDGRLVLTFDDRFRVQLRPAANGRIAIVSLLAEMTAMPPGQRDEFLVRMATQGAGMMRDHASTLALDQDEQRLVLQQLVPAAADADALESDLADFLNVLAFWSRTSLQETGRRQA